MPSHASVARFRGWIAATPRRETLAFVCLTLALSWGWWTVAYLVLAGDGGLTRALLLPGGFGPPVAAAAVTWLAGGDLRAWAGQALRWRVAPRWYLVALELPVVVVAGAVVLFAAIGVPLTPSVLAGRAPLYPVLLVVMLLVGGGQEELGWRGFALPRLQSRHSAFVAALLVGVVWAVWHLPLFLMGAARTTSGSFGIYVAIAVAASVLLTWLYNATGGSVLLAMLLHASINASGALYPLEAGVAERWGLLVDAALVAVLWLLALAVVARAGPADLSARGRVTAVAASGDARGSSAPAGTAADGDAVA